MARRRLNKKAALIGSVVFVFLALSAILLFLYLSRDPEKFIKDGDVSLMAARAAVDKKEKDDEYKRAAYCYNKARSLAKTDSLKIEMLFKLADIYLETDRWRNVLGCWNAIIQIDPKSIKARLGRLQYVYIIADSTVSQVWQWQEVESQTSEFIGVVENMGLLMEDTAKWEYPGVLETGMGMEKLGPYLYQRRGRALLEIARLGAVTDPNDLLSKAVGDLEKARELEPNNVDIYRYLAQALITRGEILASRGNIEARDENRKRAMELLEQTVGVATDEVGANITLLSMKYMLARVSDGEQIKSLEPEYLSLVEKFDSSAQAFSALAQFYSSLGYKYLDKAIEASEKAVELDRENVAYLIDTANLHYQRFSIYGQKPDIYKAIEMAKNALTFPDVQDKPGPRQGANRINRISLYLFLANCYIEQVLEPCEIRTEAESKKWLADAEQMVNEIEQSFGSGEDPHVVKWQGMLELAKGDRNIAARKLYTVYEQIEASGTGDARLSYTLANLYKNTYELGAVREFLESALKAGIFRVKPEALLDYGDVMLKLRGHSAALSAVDFFEKEYWTNQRSQILRIKIYIAARQFNEAEEELAKREPEDPNTIKLDLELTQAKRAQLQKAIELKRVEDGLVDVAPADSNLVEKEGIESQTAELKSYNLLIAKLVEKLLTVEPNSVGEASVVAVCNNYVAEGNIEQAKDLVNRFLGYFPVNVTVLLYKQLLSEPEPEKVSQQRRNEIEEQVISSITDPMQKSMRLGMFYDGHNEPNKAVGEFRKVLKMEALRKGEKPVLDLTEGVTDLQHLAVEYLFVSAIKAKDWELAEQLVEAGRRGNLDDCEGQFFAARLAMAKGEYEKVLARLEECLKQRPVFSQALALRSNANAVLGKEYESIDDAKKAASLNPLDGVIAKQLAFVLYQRNEKLGDNVSPDQVLETRNALERALALNANDVELLSFYAEYIVDTQPLEALGIRQRLQKAAPSMANAVLLGRMATKLASEEVNAERRKALFDIAASSFEQARKIDQNDKTMLANYGKYLRASGQEEKARQLFQKSDDPKLLWTYYLQGGQFEDAKRVLEQLHQADQKDSNTVKGLLYVAEKTADENAIRKYSEELLSLDDTLENRLFQIQTFLEVGLVKEAEYKLQSFKEKFPNEPRTLLLEAWVAMRRGQLKQALELVNRNLEISQDDAAAWRLRGEVNLLMANYDQAIIDLKRSRSLSVDPLTQLALVRAYQRAGRGEDAITELEAMVDQPQAPMQARKLLEQMYWQLHKKEALKSFYDEALKKFPDSVYWYNQAGAFALSVGEVDRAEQLYEQAWQKSKEKSDGEAAALDGYLWTLIQGGKMDKFFEEAGKYVNGNFAPVVYVKMAEAKLKLGDKEASVEYLRKAVDKAGTDELLVSNILQRMYTMLGAEEVLKYCKEKLQTNPDSLAANMAMFNLKKISGEYNNAADYIDKCLQIIGPNSPDKVSLITRKAEIFTAAYSKTSDNNYLKKAITEYESLLVEMPNNADILNNLAYMLADDNLRLAEALEYSKRAFETRPNDPGILDTYAYLLYKNGKLSEADEFLQAALQQYEQNRISAPSEVYEHLGMIKEGLGFVDEARVAYKQALEVGTAGLSEVASKRLKAAIERLSTQH